jgi:hypothetical protein
VSWTLRATLMSVSYARNRERAFLLRQLLLRWEPEPLWRPSGHPGAAASLSTRRASRLSRDQMMTALSSSASERIIEADLPSSFPRRIGSSAAY